jgi:hypothetical protein
LAPAPQFAAAAAVNADVASLRQAGRTLDELAAAAEDAADYGRADRLRKLARQIRAEARRLPATYLPQSAAHSPATN